MHIGIESYKIIYMMTNKKKINSSLACLIPIPLGLIIWNIMPNKIATHFNFNGNIDMFSSKIFAFIVAPILFLMIYIVIMYVIEHNSYSFGIKKWEKKYYYLLMPILSFIVFLLMINNTI